MKSDDRGAVRVIAGTLKGRRLETPGWDGLRPTSDKLRETLFNVLAPRIGGAREVAFVDCDARARALIAANLTRCGIARGCAIIRASFNSLGVFDIALLDPPYDHDAEHVIVDCARSIGPGGVLVLEHARRTPVPESAAGLRRIRQIRSGDSVLSFYE